MVCSSLQRPLRVGKRSKVVMSKRVIVDMTADEAFSLYVAFCRSKTDKVMTILKQFAVAYEKMCFVDYTDGDELV